MRLVVFFFKQKTAYEMRISDWSSDVCSSDLMGGMDSERVAEQGETAGERREALHAAVAEVMARIVGGERSAVWDLHTLSEPHMRRIIRAEARRIDLRIGDDDVLDLPLDPALALATIAPPWQQIGNAPCGARGGN